MISYEYIQFLNEKILEYLPHDRICAGDKINFKCPICGDGTHGKKRGFWYKRTASYFCFNCSTGMSGIKFLQFMSGQEYDDIKKEYLRLFVKSGKNIGLSSYYEMPKEEPNIFELKPVIKPDWKKPLSDSAKAYLDGRLITSAPFLKEDLYSCFCKRGEFIMIPWVVNGVEAYYQLNDYKKIGSIKYVFPKNSRKLLYGLDNIDISWPYIICFEGVYDSLFVKNAVACGTKSVTDYQMKLMKERYPNHQICISFDNDSPGIESMRKYVEQGEDVKFFKWFNPGIKAKDINEYVLETKDVNAFSNAKALEQMIETPLQMKMWLVQNGYWRTNEKIRFAGKKYRKSSISKTLDLKSRRALFE